MKKIIEFNFPEEKKVHELYENSFKYYSVLVEMDKWFMDQRERGIDRYIPAEEYLYSLLGLNDLDLHHFD